MVGLLHTHIYIGWTDTQTYGRTRACTPHVVDHRPTAGDIGVYVGTKQKQKGPFNYTVHTTCTRFTFSDARFYRAADLCVRLSVARKSRKYKGRKVEERSLHCLLSLTRCARKTLLGLSAPINPFPCPPRRTRPENAPTAVSTVTALCPPSYSDHPIIRLSHPYPFKLTPGPRYAPQMHRRGRARPNFPLGMDSKKTTVIHITQNISAQRFRWIQIFYRLTCLYRFSN